MRIPERLQKEELMVLARNLRAKVLQMITRAKSGHPGGSLSALDVILALYSGEMRYDATAPGWEQRDRFVLSKGHGVPAHYAVLAHYGFFPREWLMSLRELGSPLQGHPANTLLPGIEASTGSLGQGLSMAQGMAIAARIKGAELGQKKPLWNVYAILGDGELQEGQIWEAAMSAAHYSLGNLIAFVDKNKGQIDGYVNDVMNLEPLADKWASFGWHVQEIDGHSFDQIRAACDQARLIVDRPSLIIANTVKGKGVSFLEDDTLGWHGKALSEKECELATLELIGEAQ